MSGKPPPKKFGAIKGVVVRKALESEMPVSQTAAKTSVKAFVEAEKPKEVVPMFSRKARTVAGPAAPAAAAPAPSPAVPDLAEAMAAAAPPEPAPAPPAAPTQKLLKAPRKFKAPRIPDELKHTGELIKSEQTTSPFLVDIPENIFADSASKSFQDFIMMTFGSKLPLLLAQENPAFKEGDACAALRSMDPTDVKVYAYQAFVRDYLRGTSPYRGLLVYHGLGSGKTCSAIAASEALYSQSNKKIIVMTPLSLRENFLQEISFCGFRHFRYANHWEALETSEPVNRLFAASYLGLSTEYMTTVPRVWIPNFEKPANFDELSPDDKNEVKAQIRHILETRIQFINYNGITEAALKDILANKLDSFNDAVIVIDEVHNLVRNIQGSLDAYLVQGPRGRMTFEPIVPGEEWKPRLPKYKRGYLLYRLLTGVRRSKIIGLSGTPIINFPEELAILANILHGNIETVKIRVDSVKKEQIAAIKQALSEHPHVHSIGASIESKATEFIIEPVAEGYMKVDLDEGRMGLQLNEADGAKDILEFDKTLRAIIAEKFPKLSISMKPEFVGYPLLPPIGDTFREAFFDKATGKMKNTFVLMNRLSGLISYYKGASKELLPEVVEDTLVQLPMSDYQAKNYIKVRLEEQETEKASKKKKGPDVAADMDSFFSDLQAVLGGGKKAVGVSYKMRSRQACNFAFPEGIPRPRLDGDEDEAEAELGHDKEIEGDADAEVPDTTPAEEEAEAERVAADEEEAESVIETGAQGVRPAGPKPKDKKKAYQQSIQLALEKLRTQADKYFRLEGREGEDPNFRLETYSPKYAAIMRTAIEAPGSALIYSQFLMLEGLQCFGLALETNGFIPIEVKSRTLDGRQEFSFTERTLASLSKREPRYIVFSGAMTKEERQLMINIFNCNYGKLPADIVSALEEAGYEDGGVGNRNGELCKIICITAAGAEGLSLRNCRQVHIMEPYWNEVRLQQVKGRAVRICSHDYDIRQVRIFTYCMTLPEKFKKKELLGDHDMTSDEVIQGVSRRKLVFSQPLLQVLKNAAVDCVMNRVPNENEAQCFAFTAIEDGLLYTPDYKNDISIVKEAFKHLADKAPEELGVVIKTKKAAVAEVKIGEILKTVKGVPIYAVEKVEDGRIVRGEMFDKDGKRMFKWEKAA